MWWDEKPGPDKPYYMKKKPVPDNSYNISTSGPGIRFGSDVKRERLRNQQLEQKWLAEQKKREQDEYKRELLRQQSKEARMKVKMKADIDQSAKSLIKFFIWFAVVFVVVVGLIVFFTRRNKKRKDRERAAMAARKAMLEEQLQASRTAQLAYEAQQMAEKEAPKHQYRHPSGVQVDLEDPPVLSQNPGYDDAPPAYNPGNR